MKDRNILRMERCPRYPRCSVPICLLDTEKDKRVYMEGEPECALPKSMRMKLGADLPWKGMFPKEFATWKRWQKMTLDESARRKLEIATRGRQTQFQPRSQN